MGLQDVKKPVLEKSNPGMPFGIKILLWIITINMLLTAGLVWSMAVHLILKLHNGVWVPMSEFRALMMGFHIILLAVSLMGWHMQVIWQRMEEMMLYPLGMVIGSLMLDVAVWKLAMLTFSG